MCFRSCSLSSDARRRGAVLLFTLAAAGCDFNGDPLAILPEFDDVSSFEVDLEKWTARAADLGTPPATWEIVRSADRATAGSQSTRLRLGSPAGQTKIFLERRYAVEKSLLYRVEISFDFASADFAGVTPWPLLVGAAVESPTVSGAVVQPGNTANGRAADEGYVWLPKSYSMDVSSDGDGELFVYVGVLGTAEIARTYYVDNLKVALTRKGLSPPR
jgi:hypothetical protein